MSIWWILTTKTESLTPCNDFHKPINSATNTDLPAQAAEDHQKLTKMSNREGRLKHTKGRNSKEIETIQNTG